MSEYLRQLWREVIRWTSEVEKLRELWLQPGAGECERRHLRAAEEKLEAASVTAVNATLQDDIRRQSAHGE